MPATATTTSARSEFRSARFISEETSIVVSSLGRSNLPSLLGGCHLTFRNSGGISHFRADNECVGSVTSTAGLPFFPGPHLGRMTTRAEAFKVPSCVSVCLLRKNGIQAGHIFANFSCLKDIDESRCFGPATEFHGISEVVSIRNPQGKSPI